MASIPASNGEAGGPGGEGLDRVLERERLPAGASQLAEPLIAHSQRERILFAMAECCATRGYRATRVSDVVAEAGVPESTFYELFRGKEDCFHAAMEVSLAEAMGRIVEVYSPDKPWATQVRDATAAFLKLLSRRPGFARMAMVEAPAGDERAFQMYASGKRVLQSLLDRGRADPVEEEAIPSSAGRAALAAAETLVTAKILAGETERLPQLLPDIVYATTVPYVGREEALRHCRGAPGA